MKILMIYKDSNKDKPFFTHDKKVDDKNISGGGEMFCKTIYKIFNNVDVYQIPPSYDHDLSIQEKQKVSKKIIDRANDINADVIISNFSHAIHNGKVMQKSNIPVMQIVHNFDLFPSMVSRLNGLTNNNHSVFFVSKFQKKYYDRMSNRMKAPEILVTDYINSDYCKKPKKMYDKVWDCGTIGRCNKQKNPFLLKKMLEGSKLSNIIITSYDGNKWDKNYYEKNKNNSDVLWDLKHDKVLENISKCGSYFSTWDMETYGITALEALSCGLPIILNSHKSGEHASEIIPASKNHYKLIPKDDKDALISAIKSFENVDRKEIQEMTMEKHSLEKWKSHFTNCIDKTIDNFKTKNNNLQRFMK